MSNKQFKASLHSYKFMDVPKYEVKFSLIEEDRTILRIGTPDKDLAEYIVTAVNEHEQLKQDRAELVKMVKRANNNAHYGPDGVDWDKFFRESNDLLRKLGEL